MEFWGGEVKSGEPLSVDPGNGMVLNLSQENLSHKQKEDKDSEGFENDLSDSIEDGESDTDEDDDDESDEEEEDTPKKVKLGKKRPAESGNKTPGCDKKAKLATPQETDGKKGGGHVATPHPSKQAGKTPANQSKQQTPKSAGTHPCKSSIGRSILIRH
ncbi:hypothetical protein F0562_016099 [Nyssa sinensis]|uniref:Nucleoplasmin-like domain-containing protein n=1 Tax=Nyssa sinensis TaxID=561372 RepID=A0A5J4ZJ24_9ASTE|nr:hypothetical protein F0562_016099 [Nyssa sinensis]